MVWLVVANLLACTQSPHPEGAAHGANHAPAIMVPQGGYAIGGFDPVSYFEDSGPSKGLPEFARRWSGATWLFATSANRDRFESEPERYAPAYGGWCAFGVAEGYAAESDPQNAWTIHQGKLYLNWDAEVASEWRLETEAFVEKSEAQWPEVRRTLQDGSAKIFWNDE